jgi:hypothetical protein
MVPVYVAVPLTPPKSLLTLCSDVVDPIFEVTADIIDNRRAYISAQADCASIHQRLVEWIETALAESAPPVKPASP